tara:strand:- start:234 stop:365 length:132 start_codon:yes stop_codon:yes gene_type:complete
MTNNHLKISFPGKLYITTSHAVDTPMITVKNETKNVMKIVLKM